MILIRDFFTRTPPWLAPVWLAAAVLVLQGCAGTKGPSRSSPAAAAPPPAAAPARPSPLAGERQWLQSWFQGTPVAIAQRSDGAVSVDVPREHSFEAGRSQLKPALAAVLDKVAESLRRVPQARLPLAAAPGDDPTGSPLALQRANQMRAHLLQRGVSAAQMGPPTVATAAAVQLRLEGGAPH